MMSAESVQRVDQYWIGQLAIPPNALHSQTLLILPHPEPSTPYCFVFHQRAFTCVRLPATLYDSLHQAIRRPDPAILLTPAWWQHALATTRPQAIGPAYLGYADAQQFQPSIRHPTRLLTLADTAGLEAFASAVGPVAWEHSGLGEQSQPIAGCWEHDQLVAAAGYTIWGATLAHIGVATHPALRGGGYGRSVVSTIGQHALEQNYVLQYRTLLANSPSLAIAEALCFQAYATTLFIALDVTPSN